MIAVALSWTSNANASCWLINENDRRSSLWQWSDMILVVYLSNLCMILWFWHFWNRCYERIKAEKGWSSNQFAEYASEYFAYWLELVSVSSSDLTQSLFSFLNISLFNIIFLSTSHSTRVTNTSFSSLAQSLNIT